LKASWDSSRLMKYSGAPNLDVMMDR